MGKGLGVRLLVALAMAMAACARTAEQGAGDDTAEAGMQAPDPERPGEPGVPPPMVTEEEPAEAPVDSADGPEDDICESAPRTRPPRASLFADALLARVGELVLVGDGVWVYRDHIVRTDPDGSLQRPRRPKLGGPWRSVYPVDDHLLVVNEVQTEPPEMPRSRLNWIDVSDASSPLTVKQVDVPGEFAVGQLVRGTAEDWLYLIFDQVDCEELSKTSRLLSVRLDDDGPVVMREDPLAPELAIVIAQDDRLLLLNDRGADGESELLWLDMQVALLAGEATVGPAFALASGLEDTASAHFDGDRLRVAVSTDDVTQQVEVLSLRVGAAGELTLASECSLPASFATIWQGEAVYTGNQTALVVSFTGGSPGEGQRALISYAAEEDGTETCQVELSEVGDTTWQADDQWGVVLEVRVTDLGATTVRLLDAIDGAELDKMEVFSSSDVDRPRGVPAGARLHGHGALEPALGLLSVHYGYLGSEEMGLLLVAYDKSRLHAATKLRDAYSVTLEAGVGLAQRWSQITPVDVRDFENPRQYPENALSL